jgi:hypothetical protein
MKSPHYFVIRPFNGQRYDSVRKYGDIDFVISSSQEDHTVTNRVGIVDSVPIGYDGDISVGDFVIVHHNVFRIYYDMKGNERSSWNHYDEDIFIVELDQIFLYGKSEWNAPYPFCFVEPIDNDNSDYILSTDVEKYLHGYVRYIPENKHVKTGDLVSFKPESEYEFRIDNKKLYRMKLSSLCLKI